MNMNHPTVSPPLSCIPRMPRPRAPGLENSTPNTTPKHYSTPADILARLNQEPCSCFPTWHGQLALYVTPLDPEGLYRGNTDFELQPINLWVAPPRKLCKLHPERPGIRHLQ